MSIQLNMTTMGKEASLEGLEFDGDTVLCRVCGDKASGFHYGVHACEGCKGFFRRSIQQKIQYRPCLKNQQCNIMRVNRNRCQYCRLKKCVAVGMSKDAVRFGRVPKKEKARIIEQMHKSSLHSQASQMVNMIQNPQELIQVIVAAHQQTTMLSLDQVHCIRKEGLRNQDFVECPAHMACPLNSHLSDNDEDGQGWMDMSEFFTPAIKSVVNFARLIPGFSHLSQDDQVTLLKAATFEVLLVRFACLFDPDTNTMMFTNGKIFKRGPAQISTNAGFLLDSMFDFADRFNSLNLSEEEIALFSAVVLLSPDRPGLRNTENLENFQMKLTECLQTVISANHKDNTLFAKLLMKTTDLRTLSTLHSEKSIGTTDRARSQATESTDHHEAQFDSAVSECSGGNNGVSRNDSSSGATGYDSDIHDSKSSLSMLPSFSSMDSGIQSQVILKTPYGTMRRDETLGFYGLVPEHQQLRRCHTLERDILSRPRLHTIEERRRYTLEKDYVDKHIQRRHTFRGSSMPTSLANSRSGSAASSPIPPEFLAYQNHDFIPISVAEATSISARGSPMLNQDNLLPFPTVSSKPGSPNPRPRSESMGNTDLEQMRPRCYSFHMNSEGRASRFPMQGDNQLMDSNMYMSPEMRRGSVGASYGLHHRKKSLLVDRHPRYLSRLSEGMKRVDKPTKPSEASTSLPSNEHLSPLSIHVPKLAEQLSWKLDKSLLDNPVKYEDQEQDDNAMDVESPMEMDSIKEVNKESSKSSDCGQVESVFHKKFDKMRKHTPVPSDSSSRKGSFESQGNLVISEDDPERSMMDIPNQDLAKLQISDDIRESSAKPMKKSAIDSHPQLLAQLNTPSRNSFQPGFLKLPLKMSSSPSSSTQTPVMLNVPKFSGRPSASTVAKELPTLASHLNSAPVAPVYPAQMELSNGKIKEQAHSVTMSHLKEKLGRTNESAKNLSSRSPEAMNTLNKQQTEESQFSSSPEGFTSSNHEKMMNIHGMGTGMEGQERMFSSNLQKMGMHSAFLGNSPNYMPMFMMPGYNQHLAGMQQLAQIYAAKSNEEQMKRKEMTSPNSSGPHRVVDMDINVNQHLEQSVKKEIG